MILYLKMQEMNFSYWEDLPPAGICFHTPYAIDNNNTPALPFPLPFKRQGAGSLPVQFFVIIIAIISNNRLAL